MPPKLSFGSGGPDGRRQHPPVLSSPYYTIGASLLGGKRDRKQLFGRFQGRLHLSACRRPRG